MADNPTTYRITVRYDGSTLRFEDDTPIALAQDDILILLFVGVPNDRIPGVVFAREGDGFVSPLGPFRDVLQTADHVILRGNSGSVGIFQCQALLSPMLRGEERILSGNEIRIRNELTARPAKEIRVLVRPKPPSEVEVTVDLDKVTLFTPEAVIWNFVFENLEPGDFEPLLYLDTGSIPPPPPGTGPFGPFQSLCVTGFVEESRILAYRLITAGNNNVQGQYHFNVGVRSARQGELRETLSVVDPIIDNSGPPHPARP
jgi:hypothetical protein